MLLMHRLDYPWCCCYCCRCCCRCCCCCHCCCCCCCHCCHNFIADTKISYFQTDKAQNFFAVFGKRCFKSRLGKKLETMTGGSFAAKCSIGCKYLLLSNLSWIIFLREKSLPKKVNSVILYSHVASCDWWEKMRGLCFLVVSREEFCACLRLTKKYELEPQNFIFFAWQARMTMRRKQARLKLYFYSRLWGRALCHGVRNLQEMKLP